MKCSGHTATDSLTVYTIGHSNRTPEELIAILRERGIATLVDVRAHPGSRRYPQFNGDALRASLEAAAIQYHWAGRQLGGLRQAQPDSAHTALIEDGLRGYADYMGSTAFQTAAAQLSRLAARSPTAILCAERLPETCHRSLISDYLTLQGVPVVHLLARAQAREHQLRAETRRESSRLVYDRNSQGSLKLS
jgi:uncharacterized protein (DUF488 family)